MSTGIVSEKGWVVIPKELRERYGLSKGKKVHFVDYGGLISLIPAHDHPIEQTMGMLRDGSSMAQELLQDRKQELQREERERSRLG